MSRSARLSVLGLLLAVGSYPVMLVAADVDLPSASYAERILSPVIAAERQLSPMSAAEKPLSPMSAAERERIRLIVKEVIREYAAMLNEKQGIGSANGVVADIRQANKDFMRSHGPAYFKPFLDGQHPRATVITCSDSRVHTHALDATPDGDLFMIRNIGNQISTAEGSIEYGVHHLHTPLLLIIGHAACGAIKAAASDYSKESGPIRRELDTIQIPKGEPGLSSIKLNVNNQVRHAMSKFEDKVISGQLTVVGAVYDFRNDMQQGQGKLNIINVNGETDSVTIARMEMMKEAPESKPVRTMRRPAAKKAAPRGGESEENSTPAMDHDKPAKHAPSH